MIRILALDVSTWWGSVALVEQTTAASAPSIVAETGSRVDGSHAEQLLVWIARVLDTAGWSKSKLDGYAATRGPGSFTGIRIGLGTVRGLGLATGRPCLGVSTLEAIVEAHGPAPRERHPVMEAGRGELYAARFDGSSTPPIELEAAWVGLAADVVSRLSARGGLILPGPGTQLQEGVAGPPAPHRLAGAAGRLAAHRLGAGPTGDALAPLYLRPPDALLNRGRS